MDAQEIAELEKLFNEVVSAPTKEEAKLLYKKLQFKVNNLRTEPLQSELDKRAYLKLQEAVDYAGSALGQSGNKEGWRRSWLEFQNNTKLGR